MSDLRIYPKNSLTMKLTIFIALCYFVLPVFGQIGKSVDSKITEVTVFLDKAQVSREIKTRIEAGKTNILLKGLTGQLDQQSIQVSGKGQFTILGISHQLNYLKEIATPLGLQMLKDSVGYFQRQIQVEQSLKEVLNKEEQMLMSNQKIGGTTQNLTAVELKAMSDFYRTRMNDIVIGRMKSDEKIRKMNIHIGKLDNQVNEQLELFSRNTSEITISVSAENATDINLNVQYIVANAGWYPVYDLRAVDTKSPIQLNYKANVHQGTGEDWTNVKLTLSTANPSLGGLKPELNAWYLDFYQYSNSNMKFRELNTYGSTPAYEAEAKDETLVDKKATRIADFVTTIQTTLNTEFSIALPYTVSSSNKPTSVDIRSHELKADYIYSVVPKLDRDAFLLAKATGWEDFSLLPGEANIFFEGTFVGKSYIDPASTRDTLNISLGRDKRIVIKREKLKDFKERKLIGVNQRDMFAYNITVRNTKAEAIKILIEDQIPISQNNQIEVSVTEMDGALYVREFGRISWEIALPPNGSKVLTYKFEVKSPKGKLIQGL